MPQMSTRNDGVRNDGVRNGGVPTSESPQQELQARLADPETAKSLSKLLDQLETVSFAVEAVDGFIRRSDTVVESVSDTVGELRDAAPTQSVAEFVEDIPKLARTGKQMAQAADTANLEALVDSGLLERLTDPATLKTLDKLLDQLPLAVFALEAVDGFLQRGDTLTNSMAEAVGELRDLSPTVDLESLKSAVEAFPMMAEAGQRVIDSGMLEEGLPKVVAAGMQMIHAGMLDEKVVATLGQMGKAAVESYEEAQRGPAPPIGGLFAMLRAAKDPDVQKLLGFGLVFAKAFSKRIDTN